MMQNENLELTFDELAKLDKEEYILLDMRDESNIAYGMVPGAVAMGRAEILGKIEELRQYPKVVIYCTRGIYSQEVVEELRDNDICAYSMKDGYRGYIIWKMTQDEEADKRYYSYLEASSLYLFSNIIGTSQSTVATDGN